MHITIAMDGPAGAGKSSVADALAARLGILHLDTGAMYRTVGLFALQNQADMTKPETVEALLPKLDVSVRYADGSQQTLLNGQDVSTLIRTPEVSKAASDVAKIPAVRRAMVAIQQRLASEMSMLLDGRDICTRVLPNADVKIYLTASAEERARRRFLELQQKGSAETYEAVLADLIERDKQDMNRETDPLRPADDAVIVDTTGLTFDEVTEKLLALVKEAKGHE